MRVRSDVRYALVFCGLIALSVGVRTPSAQENRSPSARQGVRLNPMIAQLEQGKPALMGEVWQFVEMEHSPFSIEKLDQILARVMKKKPDGQFETAPLVRIPAEGGENVHWFIKQVLDAGAMGIIVPHVETKAQALEIVRAMRYPPQRGTKYPEPAGNRGHGTPRPPKMWGISAEEYFHRADLWPLNPAGELILQVIIESAEGVKNADEIAAVPGVSIVNVGTGDLSVSLGVYGTKPGPTGIPPETEVAVQKVLAACKKHNVICSQGGGNTPDKMKRLLAEGWRVMFKPGANAIYSDRFQ